MDKTQTTTDARPQVRHLFERQMAHAPALAKTTASERIAKLKRVEAWLRDEKHIAAAEEAMYLDFKKPKSEVLSSELVIPVAQIHHICARLRRWMKPRKVAGSLLSIGTSSYIHYEPKGVCLIISPWNYPINLSLTPLVYAIAAGNAVVLKPSEMTPHTSALMSKMLAELFPEEEVAVVEGDATVATALLELPFNHIFFTGSPQIGKVVMAAAAKHLTSVTLELGGKSPAIIDPSADVKAMAEKTVWGKHVNCGQTCIAPDYMLLHDTIYDDFLSHYADAVGRLYNPRGQGVAHSPDYARIVNHRHFLRLKGLLDDALAKGARVVLGGEVDETDNFIAPTVVADVSPDMRIMQEEIFGPLLPVLRYRTPEEAVALIRAQPKPLTMYVGSRQRRSVKYFIQETSAGGTVVNDYLMGYLNPNLPFGGVNNSGIGKSMGFHGFVEFSNERGIVHRRWGTLKPIFPPYKASIDRFVKRAMGWL